jgi:hypothetical protein
MALIDDILGVAYYLIMIPVFIMGLNLARKGLVKVNKIEGEKFRVTDWLVASMFGLLFTVAVVFCINLMIDFIIPGTDIPPIPPVAKYLLIIALGVLLVYPFWEMFYLARPSSDSVTGYHRFLEARFINKVRGKGAYVISLLLIIATYGLPITLIAFTGLTLAQATFLWIILVPLVFLNYFAASGTVSNIIKVLYTTQASNRAFPGIKKFQNLISSMMSLIKLVIALLPLILAAYGLYSSISAALEGGGSVLKVGTSAYLSLFTTVVFGIMGFFSRFWNKKSKTKSIDFIFSGYIMIAIMMNILINFMTINASQVTGMFDPTFPVIGGAIGEIAVKLSEPMFTLPLITLQNIITIVYTLIMIFQKNSDFQANIRLGAVIGSYQMASEKNLIKLKTQEEKLERKQAKKGSTIEGKPSPKLKFKGPDFVTILKSIVLEPGFNAYGVDVNDPVRKKARQYLSLIAQQSTKQGEIAKIVEYLRQHTVSKVRSAKHSFMSPEAFACLGEIGKKYPDTVLTPLLDNLAGNDLLKKRYILNALGLMGSQTGKVKQILEKEDVRNALNDESYEVKNAAVLSIVDIGLELNDVVPVLGELYKMIEDSIVAAKPRSEHFIETLLQSVLKLSIKQPTAVNIDKVLSVLDYKPAFADTDALDYILQNTLRIIAYLAHYSPAKVPIQRIAGYANDKRNFIRYIACDVLGNILLVKPAPEIIQLLVKMSLEDPDGDVRAMCNESLAEYCTHTAGESETVLVDGKQVNLLDHYLAKVNDADRFTAENASESLKSLAREFSANIYKQIEPRIAGDNEELVRDCVNVISTLNDEGMKSVDLKLLYKRLEDTSDATKAEIIRTLGYLGMTRSDIDLQVVAKFLAYEKEPEVRLNAIFAIGKIGTLQPANATGLLLDRLDSLNVSERSIELELIYEALGVIGSKHPFNEIISALDRALMGDTNPFSKDVVAKALKAIGEGLILAVAAKKERKSEGTFKMTYLPGNIVMIFLNALQLKGLPDDVIDIISDGIQDLLPYFLIADPSKQQFEYLDTLYAFLMQAYNSNFSAEILETMDRVKSLKAFKVHVDEEKSGLVKDSSRFYAMQYTPDGKQFYDQGVLFKSLGNEKYALASFEIALALNPNEYFSPQCHMEIASLVQGKDPARAKMAYDTAANIFVFFDDIAGLTECETRRAILLKK